MSFLWIIRLGFILFLFVYVLIYAFFLRDRKKYSKILENLKINFILVVCYNLFTYISVILPSDPNIIPNSLIQDSILIRIWFITLGTIVFFIAASIWIPTLKMRKVLGAQDTNGKLLTSGIYGFCRHPIYLGISLFSLGIALVLNNLDGLFVVPLIIIINLLTGKIEEIYDIGTRFKEEYPNYKKQTRMFGPIWFWILLLILIITPLLIELII